MKFNSIHLLLLLALVSSTGNAAEQLHRESCGAKALSQLITEYTDNQPISEQEIINSIRSLSGGEDEYTIKELELAAKKLGLKVTTPYLSIEKLSKLDLPAILLINLNKGFNHYVVLKGIRPKENGGTAYFYDPATDRHIKIPYTKLIENTINKEHSEFSVLLIKGSAEKLKKSSLYLSENKTELDNFHLTEDAAINLTLGNLSKKNQLIVDYGFTATLGNNKNDSLNTRSKNYNHILSIRYGLDKNSEIGGSIQYSDNTEIYSSNNYKEKFNASDRQYNAFFAKSFSLNEISDETNLTFQFNGSYAEVDDLWGLGLTIIGSKNTEFAQFSLGGSIGKQFTYNDVTKKLLPEAVNYSGFVTVFKPLTEYVYDLATSISFSVSQGENANKNRIGTFGRSYSISTSLPYQLSPDFQVSPALAYNFGKTDGFSFGMNITYVGGW